TTGADTYYYQMYWSPDSKKLLWADKKLRLRYVDIEKKIITEIAKTDVWEFSQYAWSPDSRWITYAKWINKDINKVYLYSLKDRQTFEVTDDWYDSYNPVFSSDGQYLYFVSNRDFNPIYSRTEWNHAYRDLAKIYLVPLTRKVESPFKPKSDEVAIDSKESKKEKETEEDKEVTVKVEPEGLPDRIIALPINASNYSHLTSAENFLYYTRKGAADEKTQLLVYDFIKQEETDLGEIRGYEISADGKKMLVGKNESYYVIDLPKGKLDLEDALDLSGMEMMLDRRAEWGQIFNECWRQMRDFFYVPNMHGVDWAGVRKRYEPLVPYVNHRADLTYIIGEMIGELNVGHTYVGGGDYPKPERIQTGLLGAELERHSSGYYRIKRLLKGENWNDARRSPLTEVGVDANEGDFILAIDGNSTENMDNIFEHLVNTVGKQVTLTLNSQPQPKGGRDVVVCPISNEQELYYYNRVQTNIKKVTKATDGKVGYIHIPDMGRTGLNEFVKHYYPQLTKKALIIDVRGNGGGNVSPMIIERLRREVVMIAIARNASPSVEPGGTLWGPMIMLADEFSASDGDIVVYRFKKYGLGKVVGKRTWGGVVGIRGTLPLLDDGYLRRPEFSRYDLEGAEWIMEGYGVEPDIYVDNDPAQEYAGIDQQLNRAIEEILKELKTKEKAIPKPPPYPVK
ncbi:MAG: PDZ domain-containing protein, partial [Candidatus Marinimicrobia bacterium]|nr:PDZ domain-containing protein [Candidatus Neomarinimicrobiota bacterium]